MKVSLENCEGFDWDEGNSNKNWYLHEVTDGECEEVDCWHIENITPDRTRHPKQALVWRAVKENPDGCYLICGPSGAGKSAVMWALYRWAVLSSRPAVAMSLAELIEDYRQAEIAPYEDEYVPALPLSSLQAGDDRWFIGIDDFHIAKPTRFAGEATYRGSEFCE
jgi:hypothetical protein